MPTKSFFICLNRYYKFYFLSFLLVFTLLSNLHADTENYTIDKVNSWENLLSFLQEAKINQTLVRITLLPPSQSPPINPDGNYSEPYRLDYVKWAQEIARLSLRYSNLREYTIKDLQENIDLGYLNQSDINNIITASDTINSNLSFNTNLPNHYYVDKYAGGNGNGSNWRNAAISLSALNWNNITGGDSIFVSGGNDSTTYSYVQLLNKIFTGDNVVITKGEDANHNGKVIFSAASGSTTFDVYNCQNIKITNITFKFELSDGSRVVYIRGNSENCALENCHIISNGHAHCLQLGYATNCSIINDTLEVLANNYTSEQDDINITRGNGGNTIIGNILIQRGTNAVPSKDCLQIGYQSGGTSNALTTIANNFCLAESSVSHGIYANTQYSNRFLIYNNIIVLQNGGDAFNIGLTDSDTSYNLSLRFFNNTVVTNGTNGCAFVVGNADTLVSENNIFLNNNQGSAIMRFRGLGLRGCKNINIENNTYNQNGKAIRIDTTYTGTNQISFSAWQSLGYDKDSDNGSFSFIKNISSNPYDYELKSGPTIINKGIDLSEYFSWDYNNTHRPQNDIWDKGAFEQ